jgi:FtsP/CotA-like multicopper oxidase with cupredoxin domain
MVNRLRLGVNALLAVIAVAAIGVSLIGCASAPQHDASGDSSGDSSCRRNYLTADDLTPSSMFQDPLPIPNRLTPTYPTPEQPTAATGPPVWVVHARSYTWRPADGVCIDKWGFEGTTPGPTLVAKPHQESELLVYNELPDNLYNPYVDPFNQLAFQQAIAPNRTHYTAFGPSPIEPPPPYDEAPYAQTQYELNPALAIHLHGGHQTPENDGHPMDTFGPGQSHMYDYPNNQEATTLWYHDHAMDHTRGHVLNGLAGFYLVEDHDTDTHVGLPTGDGCMSVPSIAPTAEQSPPYWPTPDPVPVDPEQPTACDDIPIMFQQVPAEMLSGQEFQPNAIAAPTDPANAPYRAVWTVNGTLAPYLTVANKPYRFRFLNGNDEEPLQIWTTTDADDPASYSSDAYLQQVGTDGGLMNSVVVADPPSQTRIRLFPAQRADVVIDFSKITTPTTIYLQSSSLQAFVGGTSPSCLTGPCAFGDNVDQTPAPLVKFVVEPTIRTPTSFDPPDGLLRSTETSSPITRTSTTTPDGGPVPERTLLFGFDGAIGRNPFATINAQFFNPQQTTAQPVVGTTEIWHLINNTDGYHPVHIHDIEFQVMSRSRCPSVDDHQADQPTDPNDPYSWCTTDPASWTALDAQPGDWASCPDQGSACNLAWTDVFVIPPYSQVSIIGTFTDNVGTYVFHCHNLIHEDAGMMAQFEVIAEASSPTATGITEAHVMPGMSTATPAD